jgi:isobutyryl-CoA mutase large subunit
MDGSPGTAARRRWQQRFDAALAAGQVRDADLTTLSGLEGSGTARQTNERFRSLLDAGGGGLPVAFDMPTLMGRDSDEPRALCEVGHCGVADDSADDSAADSAADTDVPFEGIPLEQTTTSMISGPAVPVSCMYLVAAER